MTGEQLRDALIANALRFQRAVDAMADTDTIVFTGWTMSGTLLRTHSRSEAAMHRWDLVGTDRTSIELLGDPALTRHVVTLFSAIPELDENTRWIRPPFTAEPLRLRAAGQPDVLVHPRRRPVPGAREQRRPGHRAGSARPAAGALGPAPTGATTLGR